MGLRTIASQRNAKGSVSVSTYKKGLRLRWRINNSRQALYISFAVSGYQAKAQIVKNVIEGFLNVYYLID